MKKRFGRVILPWFMMLCMVAGFSQPAAAFTSYMQAPKAPTLSLASDAIQVTWGASDYIEIWHATNANGPWTLFIKPQNSLTASKVEASVTHGKVYYYKARHYQQLTAGTEYGDWSPVASITVPLATPSVSGVTLNSTKKRVTVTCATVPGAERYEFFMVLHNNIIPTPAVQTANPTTFILPYQPGAGYKVRAMSYASKVSVFSEYSAVVYPK